MTQGTTRWTAERVRALPDDGNRYELVDGELLTSPPPSASTCARSTRRFAPR